MCYSYESKIDPDLIYHIYSEYGVTFIDFKEKPQVVKENIRPTNSILTLLKQDAEYKLTGTKWGIKFNEKSPLIFNSRIETITDKPMWKESFRKRRVMLPMTAFYESQLVEKKKVKKKITIPDDDLFFVPGLYFEKDNDIYTSLVTCPPNDFMEPIHNRMPVIIRKEDAFKMLDADIETAIKMCKPYKGKLKIVE